MIKSITIHKFRLFENINFMLGKRITVISGQNATGKSTLLGLLGATAELKAKTGTPLLKGQFRAEFSEMFSASPAKDPKIIKAMTLDICQNENWNDVTDSAKCRAGWWTNPLRYRIIPKRKIDETRFTEAKISWPTLYLGLSRLYPVGESEELISKKFKNTLTDTDKAEIGRLYSDILFQQEPVTDILGLNPSDAKRKYGVGATTPKYDHLCNSAGQDNLGQILLSVLSFKKLKVKMGEDWNGGLLLIDEFDATLHAASQVKLFDYLLNQCEEIGIQIAFTTHSLYLLKHITSIIKDNQTDVNNGVELVFLTTGNGRLQAMKNPDYDTVMFDLNMKLRRENREKIKIYCEDAEARYFAQVLLESYTERICFTNFCSGCDQLIDLFKSDDYFKKEVMTILDGDAHSKYDNLQGNDPDARINIRILPVIGSSPEKVLYDYIFSNEPTETLIACFDPTKGHNLRNIKEAFPLLTDNNLDKRVQYKKWFNKFNDNQEELFYAITKAWIDDHKKEYDAFINSFKYSFNIIASRKGIVRI